MDKENKEDLFNSYQWISFDNYIKRTTFPESINFFRLEDYYTNFIANILKQDNIYGLLDYPIKQFLKMIMIKYKDIFKDEPINNYVQNIDNYTLKINEIKTQKAIDKGRLDLFLDINIKDDKNIIIVLENKFLSVESENQCIRYENYFENNAKYKNLKKIYLYLTLDNSQECSTKSFKKINYQDIINYLIEPCYLKCQNEYKNWLDDFMTSFKALVIGNEIKFENYVIPTNLENLIQILWNTYYEELNNIFEKKDIKELKSNKSLYALYNYTASLKFKYQNKNNLNTIENKIKNLGIVFKQENKYKYNDIYMFNTDIIYHTLFDLIKENKIKSINDLPTKMLSIETEYYPTYISKEEYDINPNLQEFYRKPKDINKDLNINGTTYYYKTYIPQQVMEDYVAGYIEFCNNKNIKSKISN